MSSFSVPEKCKPSGKSLKKSSENNPQMYKNKNLKITEEKRPKEWDFLSVENTTGKAPKTHDTFLQKRCSSQGV